jgi:hypothetical protein
MMRSLLFLLMTAGMFVLLVTTRSLSLPVCLSLSGCSLLFRVLVSLIALPAKYAENVSYARTDHKLISERNVAL